MYFYRIEAGIAYLFDQQQPDTERATPDPFHLLVSGEAEVLIYPAFDPHGKVYREGRPLNEDPLTNPDLRPFDEWADPGDF